MANRTSDLRPATGESVSASERSKQILEQAYSYLQLGELQGAERSYRLILLSDPDDGKALHGLASILRDTNRLTESAELIDRALRISPDSPDAHYLRGSLHQANGEVAETLMHFEEAVALRPSFEVAHRELVLALYRAGRVLDAKQKCTTALSTIPNSAELHFYLSNLYRHANNAEAAIASVRTALSLRPSLIAARASLSDLLSFSVAEEANASPEKCWEIAAGYADLGVARLWCSEFAGAQDAFAKAVALAPGVAEHQYNLGSTLTMQQDIEGARKHLDHAILLDPKHSRARLARSLMHASPFPVSPTEAAANRREIIDSLDKFSDWLDGCTDPPEHYVGLHAPFYLSYQEQNNRQVFERYGSMCSKSMERLSVRRRASHHGNKVVPGRIRIGIVSADVREHSVWFALIKGWIEHLDRKRFEIGIFSLTSTPDRETEWAQLHADFFVAGSKSVQQWVETITDLKPSALIYPAIGMDILTSQLASLRLAATQINTWGHPETSGLPTMDIYLSAKLFEPGSAQEFYTEELIPLRNLGNCYQRRVNHAVEPDLNALEIDAARPILICSGTAFKYQVEHDIVLTAIASRIRNSQLIFFRQHPESLSDLLKDRIKRAFSQAGLDFNWHVRFLAAQPLNSFHGLLGRADLALDTIGFSGYNTAIQAIESGLPVVTREGRFLRGRLASGILKRLEMQELIAQSTHEYVNLAARLVEDKEFNQRIRAKILERREILYNDTESIRHLEKVLEERLRS